MINTAWSHVPVSMTQSLTIVHAGKTVQLDALALIPTMIARPQLLRFLTCQLYQ